MPSPAAAPSSVGPSELRQACNVLQLRSAICAYGMESEPLLRLHSDIYTRQNRLDWWRGKGNHLFSGFLSGLEEAMSVETRVCYETSLLSRCGPPAIATFCYTWVGISPGFQLLCLSFVFERNLVLPAFTGTSNQDMP